MSKILYNPVVSSRVCVVALMLFTIGLGTLLLWSHWENESEDHKSWQKTLGTITESEKWRVTMHLHTSTYYKTQVEYRVGGKIFTKSMRLHDDDFASKSEVWVSYDPKNPQNSINTNDLSFITDKGRFFCRLFCWVPLSVSFVLMFLVWKAYRCLLTSEEQRKLSPRWQCLEQYIHVINYAKNNSLSRPLLEPPPRCARKKLSIEEFARKICDHLGLKGELDIKWTRMSHEDVFASVSIGNMDKKIHISLDEDRQDKVDMLKASLVHLLTTKLFESRGFYTSDKPFIDVSSIVAGMGKYVLNGIYSQTSRYTDSSTICTTTSQLGSLPRDIFGFVYQYDCLRRDLSCVKIFSRLGSYARGSMNLFDINELVAFKHLAPFRSLTGYLLYRFVCCSIEFLATLIFIAVLYCGLLVLLRLLD